MKKLILILIICLSACQINSDDKAAARQMFDLIGGSGQYFLVTEEPKDEDSIEKKYIEVEIEQSVLLDQPNMDKELVASLCASFLYTNLASKRIKENDGINITFSDDDISTELKKPFFYTMSELTIINVHCRKIDDFFKSFNLGSDPQDFISNDLTQSKSKEIDSVIQTIDSLKYYNARVLTYFHERHKNENRMLITGVYELNNNQFAIHFLVDKNPIDKPIYRIKIKK